MTPQPTPLYAVEVREDHATLHLVIGWEYSPPMPLAVPLASTKPGRHLTDAQPLNRGGVTYFDDRGEARSAYEAAARTAGGLA